MDPRLLAESMDGLTNRLLGLLLGLTILAGVVGAAYYLLDRRADSLGEQLSWLTQEDGPFCIVCSRPADLVGDYSTERMVKARREVLERPSTSLHAILAIEKLGRAFGQSSTEAFCFDHSADEILSFTTPSMDRWIRLGLSAAFALFALVMLLAALASCASTGEKAPKYGFHALLLVAMASVLATDIPRLFV